VHAQAVANYERVAFSVVFPGSWLRFASSFRRFATVVVVESEDVQRPLLTVRGLERDFRARRNGAGTELVKFGARTLTKENGAEGIVR